MTMARLKAFVERTTATRAGNLGKVLLFCEGPTEVCYFEHFSKIIRAHRNKYSHIDIVPVPAGGNAQAVLNFAEAFLSDEENLRMYSLYEKHLVFDCDAPPNIQAVIHNMLASAHGYDLLLTNLLFETWLLMHVEEVDHTCSHSKKKIMERLSHALGREYGKKQDDMPGIVRQLIGDGDNLRKAISYADSLDQTYTAQHLHIQTNILQMNPYTSVHRLMELILSEMQKIDGNP